MTNKAKKSSDTIAVAGAGAYLIGAAITAGVFVKWGIIIGPVLATIWPLSWIAFFAWWLA